MTREETKSLLMYMASVYPSFKADDMSKTVDAWGLTLEPYDAQTMIRAAVYLVRSTKEKFAPSPGELIAAYEKLIGQEAETVSEAWGKYVVPAIRRSLYYAGEEYEKLPPACQIAVGSPDALRAWAMQEEEAMSITESNFRKAYPKAVEKARSQFLLTGSNEITGQITGDRAHLIGERQEA